MEAKNIIAFDFEKEDRCYRLSMPSGAPLGEAYEAASCFLAEMVKLINDHAESAKPKEPEDVDIAEQPEE